MVASQARVEGNFLAAVQLRGKASQSNSHFFGYKPGVLRSTRAILSVLASAAAPVHSALALELQI